MRIRTVKPEFWTHEALSALPAETHMLAAALLNYADDEGYFNANPKLVQAACMPLRELSLSIHGMLTELSNTGFLRLGTGKDGRIYGHIEKFLEHQVINRPTASKIKDLEIVWERSVSTHGALSEPSLLKGKERKGKERNADTKSASEFDEWYSPYPRKVGKPAALKAFVSARKKASFEVLLAGAQRAAKQFAGTDPQYIPYPATWLNQERWNDPEPKSKGDKATDEIYKTLRC